MLFTVENQHVKSGGTPPEWINGPRLPREHRSYFENEHGEQWVASATPDRLLFTGGDLRWEEHKIEKPDYQQLIQNLLVMFTAEFRGVDKDIGFDGVLLNQAERFWLLGVCSAAQTKR